ncbi:MAG: hypothetical protein CMJ81_23850 [Planctomycetaceae bacterium]|nr:hypothetical protein [Planctomycetaceae bacterium]
MDTRESFAAVQILAQGLHNTNTFDTSMDHRSLDNSNLDESSAKERHGLNLSAFMPQSHAIVEGLLSYLIAR